MIDSTKTKNTEIKMKRKFKVQMNNKKVGYSRSDVTLINEQTWKKIRRPMLLKMEKIARGITGNKLKFVGECYTNVTFMGKTL